MDKRTNIKCKIMFISAFYLNTNIAKFNERLNPAGRLKYRHYSSS
jgi:hypothetical protein